ncbi:cytochrome c [bacterium]|nr:cytochrome c [bacterium]
MKIKNIHIPLPVILLTGIVAVVLFVLWAGNGFQALRSKEPPIKVRFDMYYQSKYMAQEPSTFFADRTVMRGHVPGTLPRNGTVYPYTTPEEAEAALHNPLAVSPEVLARGKNRFNTFCSPCHSPSGQDTTEVVRRGLQKPPNLAGKNAKGYSDAHIFHVISVGQNIMPGYADKLKEGDRWAIVNYVRELQKAPLKYPETAPASVDSTAAGGDSGAAQNANATDNANENVEAAQ